MKKTCKNCTQIKLSSNHCIDMTCYRGYVDGDHDGWTDKPQIDINSWPNEATEKDYSYNPFKEKFNRTE
jgi:hypothetical protein